MSSAEPIQSANPLQLTAGEEDAGIRLDKLLAQRIEGLSRARIQALIRRRAADTADLTHLCIDDLEMDLQARKVTRAGVRLDLTAKEFSLLSLLARHQGEILSKLMIAEQVWDMNFDSDANVVEVAIKRVRAKVDAPYARKLLHTVRGMGYVLESREDNNQQGRTAI